jgi:hypothetical protein
MKRLDVFEKQIEAQEETFEGIVFEDVHLIEDLNYFDWHYHEKEYRRARGWFRWFFPKKIQKVELSFSFKFKGIDKVFLLTQVIEDVHWKRTRKYGKKYAIKLNGIVKPIIIDDIVKIRYKDVNTKEYMELIDDIKRQILSLIYIEQINITDKDEVLDFLTTAFEHESGLFYKEENYFLE